MIYCKIDAVEVLDVVDRVLGCLETDPYRAKAMLQDLQADVAAAVSEKYIFWRADRDAHLRKNVKARIL